MLSKWEELSLIARCVAGDDRRAFERLVIEYNDALRRFLLNLTLGDASLADDLAQDSFLKAYLSIRSFKGLASFKTWLYRIACNEYYAWRRSNHEVAVDVEYPPPESDYVSSDNVVEASIDVERCLKALSDAERTAVLLFYLEDRPIKEIARIMEMPDGTVKSHLHRAKIKMARQF